MPEFHIKSPLATKVFASSRLGFSVKVFTLYTPRRRFGRIVLDITIARVGIRGCMPMVSRHFFGLQKSGPHCILQKFFFLQNQVIGRRNDQEASGFICCSLNEM
jgi:hypothetical protein